MFCAYADALSRLVLCRVMMDRAVLQRAQRASCRGRAGCCWGRTDADPHARVGVPGSATAASAAGAPRTGAAFAGARFWPPHGMPAHVAVARAVYAQAWAAHIICAQVSASAVDALLRARAAPAAPRPGGSIRVGYISQVPWRVRERIAPDTVPSCLLRTGAARTPCRTHCMTSSRHTIARSWRLGAAVAVTPRGRTYGPQVFCYDIGGAQPPREPLLLKAATSGAAARTHVPAHASCAHELHACTRTAVYPHIARAICSRTCGAGRCRLQRPPRLQPTAARVGECVGASQLCTFVGICHCE